MRLPAPLFTAAIYGHLASAVLVFAFSLMPLSGQAYWRVVREYCRHCRSLKRCRRPGQTISRARGPSVMGNSSMHRKMASLFVPLGVTSIGIALIAKQTATKRPEVLIRRL